MKNEVDKEVKAALFISLSHGIPGLPNPGVLRFETEEEAEEFAFHALVDAKHLVVNPDGSIWSDDRQENYLNRSEAIDCWQDALGVSEYFHVYECRDATNDSS